MEYILGLFILLVVIISMGSIFGSNIMESFQAYNGMPSLNVGHKLKYKANINIPKGNLIGNMRYPGRAYIGTINGAQGFQYDNSSDDAPSSFGFP